MDNKWWEYYAVRYFVGTVTGALIVAFLNSHPGSPYETGLAAFGEFKDSTILGVSLIAAVGFAFCYIASAPILTLHATRAHLQLSVLKSHWGKQSFAILASIVISVCGASLMLPLLAASMVGIIIGIQLFLLLSALFTNFSKIESFYNSIASVRAKATPKKDDPPTENGEYITSYRHLREHGNAFSIVVLELVLAYSLYKLHNTTCAPVLVLLWVLPATSTWFIGTILETRLAGNNTPKGS